MVIIVAMVTAIAIWIYHGGLWARSVIPEYEYWVIVPDDILLYRCKTLDMAMSLCDDWGIGYDEIRTVSKDTFEEVEVAG